MNWKANQSPSAGVCDQIDSKSHTFWQLVGAYGRNAENVVKAKQNEGSTKAPAGTGRNQVMIYSKTL